jgi:hypothetical protein
MSRIVILSPLATAIQGATGFRSGRDVQDFCGLFFWPSQPAPQPSSGSHTLDLLPRLGFFDSHAL